MAEFVEVSLQMGRMCDKYDCVGCPLYGLDYCNKSRIECTREDHKKAEAIIMKWAKENPEPVYPTWGDWLNSVARQMADGDLLSSPIPTDIAEKLGIEPKEANGDDT